MWWIETKHILFFTVLQADEMETKMVQGGSNFAESQKMSKLCMVVAFASGARRHERANGGYRRSDGVCLE